MKLRLGDDVIVVKDDQERKRQLRQRVEHVLDQRLHWRQVRHGGKRRQVFRQANICASKRGEPMAEETQGLIVGVI